MLKLEGLANDFVGKGSLRRRTRHSRARSRRATKRGPHPSRQRRPLRSNQRLALCRGPRRRALCRAQLRSTSHRRRRRRSRLRIHDRRPRRRSRTHRHQLRRRHDRRPRLGLRRRRRFPRQGRYHGDFLHPETWEQLDVAARDSIRELVALHADKTASTRAQWLWPTGNPRRTNSFASPRSRRPSWPANAAGFLHSQHFPLDTNQSDA